MTGSSYIVALGSNRRGRHGGPRAEVLAAMHAIGATRASPVVASAPIGPSTRRFANAAAVIVTDESPPALLARLQSVEAAFGRRRGRRWGERVIDLDIVLWSRGTWRERTLTVPHVAFRRRGFVLGPVAAIVPCWRDPLTGRTMRQLAYRQRLSRLTVCGPAPTSPTVGS